jgi:hypothetical protein
MCVCPSPPPHPLSLPPQNINLIVPQPMCSMHDTYLRTFVESGRSVRGHALWFTLARGKMLPPFHGLCTRAHTRHRCELMTIQPGLLCATQHLIPVPPSPMAPTERHEHNPDGVWSASVWGCVPHPAVRQAHGVQLCRGHAEAGHQRPVRICLEHARTLAHKVMRTCSHAGHVHAHIMHSCVACADPSAPWFVSRVQCRARGSLGLFSLGGGGGEGPLHSCVVD